MVIGQDLNPAQQQFVANAIGQKGRITIVCIADGLDREALAAKLQERGPRFLLQSHADVLYGAPPPSCLTIFQEEGT